MQTVPSRGLCVLIIALPAALVSLVGGYTSEAQEDPAIPLIKQLGSTAYPIRDEASRKLIELSEKAIPALRKAAVTSEDAEVRRRAKELVRAILPTSKKSPATGMEFVLIEAAEFKMGSPTTERNRRIDETLHRVRIKDSFYIGAIEVTQGEFRNVMKASPSWFSPTGAGRLVIPEQDTSKYPVENVTWFDAIEFCNKLSEKDGLAPFYKLADLKRDDGCIRLASVTVLGGAGYRLPTEAEWEFACRAYTDWPYYFGGSAHERNLNCKSSIVAGGYGAGPLWKALERTAPARSYTPNTRFLYEMLGNAGEWCWDYYDKDYYAVSPFTDPQGPKTGDHRVVRGGSWLLTEASCRSASRASQLPGDRSYTVGFRVARSAY
ncbi:MAG: formylglycine-generating enzyme family protein [Planctomycetes bacterium]|nr:formylglycine-generating enzyme family protein [Planctomycetota bacterium]